MRPLGFAALVLTAVGCQMIGGLNELEFRDEGSTGAAGGAGGTGGAGNSSGSGGGGGGGGTTCEPVTAPARPPAGSDPGDQSFVLAVRSMDLGEGKLDAEGLPTTGLDLDGLCTCDPGDAPGCVVPEFAGDPANRCDGPKGRDNNLARVLSLLAGAGLSSSKVSESIEAGGWSLLIGVRDYNGQPNDDQVRVAVFSAGSVGSDPCQGGAPVAPLWDGTDRWPVPTSAVSTNLQAPSCVDEDILAASPRFEDAAGYVRDGVLVGGLDGAGFDAITDVWSLPISLGEGFVVGQLEQRGGLWTLSDGLLVGRLATAGLFESVSRATLVGQPLCMDSMSYGIVKSQVCRYVDLPASFGGPSAPCDAISYGIGINAVQARLGGVLPPPSLTSQCPPDLDPATDACD